MKYVNGWKMLETGDVINCCSVEAKIHSISYQFDAGKEGMICEFYDTNNQYRVWNQQADGGYVVGYETFLLNKYFEADNLCELNMQVLIRENYKNQDVLDVLKEIGFIQVNDELLYDLNDTIDFIEITDKTINKPIGRLQLVFHE